MNKCDFGREITSQGLHGFLIEKLKKKAVFNSVLDLGCGQGAWLKRLESSGYKNLIGIDWNIEDSVSANVTIKKGDINHGNIELGDKKFDLITIIEVIEHISNQGKLLEMANNHLSDSGFILITTPNIHSLIQRLKFLITGRFTHFDYGSDPTHYQPILLDAWQRMLPLYGLTLVEKWTYPDSNRLDGISQWWRYFAAVLQFIVRNDLPGEILCVFLKKI